MQGVALLIQFLCELSITSTRLNRYRFGFFINSDNLIEIRCGNLIQRTIGNVVETMAGAQRFLLTQLFGQGLDFFNGFRVVEVEINGNDFIVRRGTTSATESERVHNINMSEKTCNCGEWQDQGYPCIDAVAYFRLHKKMTLNSILLSTVEKFLTYEKEYEMLKTNIYPVCIETISPDGCTLPPDASKQRSGRPRRKRIWHT